MKFFWFNQQHCIHLYIQSTSKILQWFLCCAFVSWKTLTNFWSMQNVTIGSLLLVDKEDVTSSSPANYGYDNMHVYAGSASDCFNRWYAIKNGLLNSKNIILSFHTIVFNIWKFHQCDVSVSQLVSESKRIKESKRLLFYNWNYGRPKGALSSCILTFVIFLLYFKDVFLNLFFSTPMLSNCLMFQGPWH